MDLCQSLKTTISVSRLLCSFPLKTAENVRNGLNTFSITELFSFSIFLIGFSLNICSQIAWFQIQNNVSILFSGSSKNIICICTYIIGISTSTLCFENTLNLFNELVVPLKQYHKEFNKILKRKIEIPLILGILLTITFVLCIIHIVEGGFLSVSQKCSFAIIHISVYVIHIQFITFIVILNQCFSIINHKLLHLSNNININNVMDSTFEATSEMMDNSNTNLQTKSTCRENKRVIKILSKLHDSLRTFTHHVNAIYAGYILLHLLELYLQLAFSIYYILSLILLSEFNEWNKAFLPLSIFCIHIIKLLQLASHCYTASIEVSLFSLQFPTF
ncbi:hypothetical protein L9F63_021042, partial [Diploptera punctata]